MRKSFAHFGDLKDRNDRNVEKKDRNVDKVSSKIIQFNSAILLFIATGNDTRVFYVW